MSLMASFTCKPLLPLVYSAHISRELAQLNHAIISIISVTEAILTHTECCEGSERSRLNNTLIYYVLTGLHIAFN